MATTRDMLAQTRHHLMTTKADVLNQLDGAVTANADTITFVHPVIGVSAGTRLAIDLEIYHVVNMVGQEATVIPAIDGSTSSPHSDRSLIYIAPQFSDFRIATYLNEALEDVSGDGLFQIKDYDFTFIPSTFGYEIVAPDMIDIWRVRYDTPGPTRDWPMFFKNDWHFDQNADPTDFPSGLQLVLHRGAFPGHTVRVSYKAGFTDLFNFATFDPTIDLADDVTTVTGLHREACSILPRIAALTLLGGRDIVRSFLNRQQEPRRQEEVPPGAASQAMRPLLQEVQEEMSREIRRLRRRFPEQIH